jgi:hypothetical protein
VTNPAPPNKWTQLVIQLNALRDSGEHLDFAATTAHIEGRTVFGRLEETFPFPELDLSL